MRPNFRFSRRLNASRRRARGGIASLRKILHAEPPLNPLHRVEVIFARIFLVFCPSSRIGGSRLSLSFSLSPFRTRRARVLPLPRATIVANPRSLFVRLSIYLRFSLSISWHVLRHGQFRGHEVALYLREKRCIHVHLDLTHAREIFETILLTKLSLASPFGEINSYCQLENMRAYIIFFSSLRLLLNFEKNAIRRKTFRLVSIVILR